jgi:hypothetical protein
LGLLVPGIGEATTLSSLSDVLSVISQRGNNKQRELIVVELPQDFAAAGMIASRMAWHGMAITSLQCTFCL